MKRLAIIRSRINGVWKIIIFEPLPQTRTIQ